MIKRRHHSMWYVLTSFLGDSRRSHIFGKLAKIYNILQVQYTLYEVDWAMCYPEKKWHWTLFKADRKRFSFPARLSAKMSLHDLSGQYEKLLEDNTDIAKFRFFSYITAVYAFLLIMSTTSDLFLPRLHCNTSCLWCRFANALLYINTCAKMKRNCS